MERQKIAKVLLQYSVLLSLLFHLLLLISFSMVLTLQPLPELHEKTPQLYVPSYVYRQPSDSPLIQQNNSKAVSQPIAEDGIEKSITPQTKTAASNQPNATVSSKNSEPIYLVGETSVIKPLIKLLGKALSAHLVYPKIAVDFKVKGNVSIGFVLHPDGSVTDIRLVKSSRAALLDEAALAAVRAMSPIKDVNLYLKEPKFLVVGVIFA